MYLIGMILLSLSNKYDVIEIVDVFGIWREALIFLCCYARCVSDAYVTTTFSYWYIGVRKTPPVSFYFWM